MTIFHFTGAGGASGDLRRDHLWVSEVHLEIIACVVEECLAWNLAIICNCSMAAILWWAPSPHGSHFMVSSTFPWQPFCGDTHRLPKVLTDSTSLGASWL